MFFHNMWTLIDFLNLNGGILQLDEISQNRETSALKSLFNKGPALQLC